MPDEKKNITPDDEYQFPQDEYISKDNEHQDAFGANVSDAEKTSDKAGASKFQAGKWIDYLKNIKNKRVVFVIIGLVVLVLGYRLFSGDEKAPTLPPVVTQPATPTPAPVVATPVEPSGGGEMMSSLDSLRSHASETAGQIKTLQAQVIDLQNALQQTQSANQQLQKSVVALTGQLNTLSAEMNNLIANAAPRKGKRIVFHLRAVVPDRAWITANTGETMSVTLGDRIDQYGTVTAIDAGRGIIDTSSGRKIGYGQNDY